MALGVYPYAIPEFPTFRNLQDDINANDINTIQREVSSIAGVLGQIPHIMDDVSIASPTIVSVPTGTGDTSDTITYSPIRTFDPSGQVTDFGTVANRLRFMTQGKHVHCFKLLGAGIPLAGGDLTAPKAVRLPLSNPDWDPAQMYNGSGVVLRKSGFWVIQAAVYFTRQGENADGVYQASVDRDGNWAEGTERDRVINNSHDVSLNPSLTGFYERGTTLTLRAAHSAPVSQQIALASLSGYLLREA